MPKIDKITEANFQEKYQESLNNPNAFWREQAQSLDWITPFDELVSGNLTEGDIHWFAGGEINICYNCLDRHLDDRADQTAIIWEGDEPGQEKTISFRALHEQVCKFANVLKSQGIAKGDRVCFYLPMIVEAAVAMLACARIGAVHSIVFGGFSPQALAMRVQDAQAKVLITSDVGYRGGKEIPFKQNVDTALEDCPSIEHVIVVKRSESDCHWVEGRDVNYAELMGSAEADCPCEPMASEDPFFILYTSGSTGNPKGVLHTTAGYLLWASLTHRTVFDLEEGDVYWCTADIGWITGHSYVVYGPLANGCTTLMFEGVPNYPTVSRFWEVIDRWKVTIFYTAPTAIRALMRYGAEPLASTNRDSLRILGSVGEPINPECWEWYFEHVGLSQCPVMDTWWQTETGGIMLSPPVDKDKQKPGAAMRPLPGIEAVILDDDGNEISAPGNGVLAIKRPWPGMLRTVYGDHDRFMKTYLSDFPGYYFSGDAAHYDDDGDIWIRGRTDDVLNVSGHRLGTAEIESALVLHEAVSEAAVVGFPHEIKGEGIFAYVTLMDGFESSDALRDELIAFVREQIGPIATIDHLLWADDLPKTRSGKIMRRILRKIAQQDTDDLGDTSTLADPSVVEVLIEARGA